MKVISINVLYTCVFMYVIIICFLNIQIIGLFQIFDCVYNFKRADIFGSFYNFNKNDLGNHRIPIYPMKKDCL